MKSENIVKKSSLLFLMAAAVSCNLLDKAPESTLTPEQYLSTEAGVASFATDRYQELPSHGEYSYGTFETDKNTDNMAHVYPSDMYAPGYWKVEQTGGGYYFSDIYQCNWFFDNVLPLFEAGEITGNQENVRHYIGEMYFFRAFAYFNHLRYIGDFPIVTSVLPDNMEVLVAASRRAPRNEVARFILSDLDKAIEMMKEVSPDGSKNRLNKACAHLLKSRVALFEGTWLKYFKGTAFVPNGDGWPGKDKAYNADYQYPLGGIDEEVEWFLKQAMDEAKIVADSYELVRNTGTYQNLPTDEANPYYDMFSSVDMKDFSEVMLWRRYDVGQGIVHGLNGYASRGNNGCGTTKSMVDAFLMASGKPIYASGSGYPGDADLKKIADGRDTRLKIFLKRPGDNNFHNEAGPEGVTVEPWPDITSSTTNLKYTTGYTLRKGKGFNGEYASFQDPTGCIIFRAAEAYLNYIEASYELTGSVDATADSYWKAIRRRAGVDEDWGATVALTDMDIEAETDWGAYSAGHLVDPTLFNIRRERRCELMAEGFRDLDLHRWRAMDQMITTPYHVLGMNLWENVDLAEFGTLEENKTVSSHEFSKYLAPYHISANNRVYGGYSWRMAHYLSPIAIQHFLITGNGNVADSPLYQNPGWPLQAGAGADK